jgi:hypothetical protein
VIPLTGNRPTVPAINRRRALLIPPKRILDILRLVSANIELKSSIRNIVSMISIDPSALGHILLLDLPIDLIPILFFQLARGLDAVVPRLAAAVADVTGPDAAFGAIVLLDGDPGDAGCVVVVGDADVAAAAAWDGLVDGFFAGAAACDAAAVGLAGVAVALVEGVNFVDGAALGWCC